MVMPVRQYRNPPIEEALCELRMTESAEWDLTIPGRLYEHIKQDYQGRRQQQLAFQAEAQPAGVGAPITVRHGLAKIQFPTEDGTRLVAIGPNVLSVHMLRPYTGWSQEFRPRIERAIKALRETVGSAEVDRIGLRYINRLVFPPDKRELDTEDYFTIREPFRDTFPTFESLLIRTEVPIPDKRERVALTLATGEPEDEHLTMILDIDVIWQSEGQPVGLDRAMAIIERLKLRERNTFEALITDRAREMFDAD